MTESSRNSIMFVQSSLAKCFHKLTPSKAHWYSILPPSNDEPNASFIRSIFPSLSNLLSLDEDLWKAILVHLGLASYWCGTVCSPYQAAWERFIGKFKLKVEVSAFKLARKQRYFVQIGSWDKKRHLLMRPIDIWAKAVKDCFYNIPRLRVSLLSMRFASAVADLDLNLMQHKNKYSVIESDSEEEPSVTEAEADESGIKEQSGDVAIPDKAVVTNLPAEDFPLLCSLGVHSEFHMDALIREVVKYHGRKSIKYMQLNNRIGFLLPLPSA